VHSGAQRGRHLPERFVHRRAERLASGGDRSRRSEGVRGKGFAVGAETAPFAVIPRYAACPQSAQTLDCNAGNELCELAKMVLVAGDDEVATERRRGDDRRFDRVRPSGAR